MAAYGEIPMAAVTGGVFADRQRPPAAAQPKRSCDCSRTRAGASWTQAGLPVWTRSGRPAERARVPRCSCLGGKAAAPPALSSSMRSSAGARTRNALLSVSAAAHCVDSACRQAVAQEPTRPRCHGYSGSAAPCLPSRLQRHELGRSNRTPWPRAAWCYKQGSWRPQCSSRKRPTSRSTTSGPTRRRYLALVAVLTRAAKAELRSRFGRREGSVVRLGVARDVGADADMDARFWVLDNYPRVDVAA
jgi:hypothetical protein